MKLLERIPLNIEFFVANPLNEGICLKTRSRPDIEMQ